jgi:hypothetical protein
MKEAMVYQEIINTYKKMGLGTQEERNQFMQWFQEINIQNTNLVFIIETPNSKEFNDNNKNG